MKNKKLSLIFSVLLTIALLAILIVNVDFSEVISSVAKLKFIYFLPAFLFHISAYFFRTWSFYLLTENKNTSFTKLLAVHFIHNFYVHVVPASLGELSFPILLKKEMKASESLSILLISRIVSMLFTVILFVMSLFFVFNFENNLVFDKEKYFLVIGLAFVFLLILFYFRRKIYSLLQTIAIVRKLIEKINSFVNTLKTKLILLKDKLKLTSYLIAVLMSILATSFFFLMILKGVNIELNLFQIIFVSSIGVAFIILPIKSIGGFGTTEGAWTIGLMLIGLTKELSIAAGFVVHIYALINVLIIFTFGIIINFLLKRKNTNIPKEHENEI